MDQLSIKLVKLAAPLITHAITAMFNKSTVLGTFPREWKISKVTPVYKSGEREVMNNYGPISVISIVAKVVEKLVYNQRYEYFINNDMLTTSQHGFKPNQAYFPLGEFVRASRQKSRNASYLFAANFFAS